MSFAKTSILLLLQRSGVARARNPIVRGMGLADPHLHVWPSEENSSFYYIYGTHDYSSNNTGFLMKDWWVWSSTDLVEWEEASVLTPNNTPADPATYNECCPCLACCRSENMIVCATGADVTMAKRMRRWNRSERE